MEDNPDAFPEADLFHIFRKIKNGAKKFNTLQEYAVDLLRKLDKDGNGVIPF